MICVECFLPSVYYRVHKACNHQLGLYLYFQCPVSWVMILWSHGFSGSFEHAAACFAARSRIVELCVIAGKASLLAFSGIHIGSVA
jgi:hypothetical protein